MQILKRLWINPEYSDQLLQAELQPPIKTLFRFMIKLHIAVHWNYTDQSLFFITFAESIRFHHGNYKNLAYCKTSPKLKKRNVICKLKINSTYFEETGRRRK